MGTAATAAGTTRETAPLPVAAAGTTGPTARSGPDPRRHPIGWQTRPVRGRTPADARAPRSALRLPRPRPPERTNERGPRSTGIADAYYAAYLRGEVDLADPPELDVYPRDEPDFNPIGPRWRMPDGTWFGEGPPDPRRTFDKEAHEKKVYWGTKEELMRAERVAIGLEEPYVHPDDVIVKLISRPEGYWTITAKDEREGKPGTFTATPEVAEKVRRAMEEGDEAPTWASTSPKSPFQGKSEKDDETNEANLRAPATRIVVIHRSGRLLRHVSPRTRGRGRGGAGIPAHRRERREGRGFGRLFPG